MRSRLPLLCALAAVILWPAAAGSQTNGQLWGEVLLERVKDSRLTYILDLEPKALVSAPAGDPGWWTLDITPSVDWVARNWLDLTGEVLTAYTKQTNDVNSFELTERFGVRFHLFSRDVPTLVEERLARRERPPKRRVVIRNYLRIEQRNLFYSGTKPDSSTWRLRNRLEFEYPLNRERMSADGATYVLTDWEWFIPLTGDADERFANKQRIRVGLGHRRSLRWSFEALYIWGRSRNTIGQPYTTSDNIVDIRVKRVF
jgi:hypothetical protein